VDLTKAYDTVSVSTLVVPINQASGLSWRVNCRTAFQLPRVWDKAAVYLPSYLRYASMKSYGNGEEHAVEWVYTLMQTQPYILYISPMIKLLSPKTKKNSWQEGCLKSIRNRETNYLWCGNDRYDLHSEEDETVGTCTV